MWLAGSELVDQTGKDNYGPFNNLLGVVLHVNQAEDGTPVQFFVDSQDVTPNFQVYKDGRIVQFLPFNWQPWCQSDGNQTYAAIETAGLDIEPLTDAQVISISKIIKVYHDSFGVPYQLAEVPGERGFGWHGMGGNPWGGHFGCPGDLRKAQRQDILDIAQADIPVPPIVKVNPDMATVFVNKDAQALKLLDTGSLIMLLKDNSSGDGAPIVKLAANDYAALRAKAV